MGSAMIWIGFDVQVLTQWTIELNDYDVVRALACIEYGCIPASCELFDTHAYCSCLKVHLAYSPHLLAFQYPSLILPFSS